MNYFFRLIILIAFLLPVSGMKAQTIAGCWEGYMSGEFLQVNIDQKDNQLCGYTYDYELSDRRGYCIANFTGRFEDQNDRYVIDGTSFIANSGTHVLMRIYIWRNPQDPKNILRGKVYIRSGMSLYDQSGDPVTLKKISDKPKKIAGKIFPCFPKPAREATVKTAPVKVVPARPVPSKPVPVPVKKPKTEPAKPGKLTPVKITPVKKDSVPKPAPKPVVPIVITKSPPSQLEKVMTTRRQNQQGRVTVDVNEIKLKVYDNGTVDNDTVSIFYNGRLLLSHQRLSEKAIELTVKLDEGATQHEITMFAENLGSIPPNTALIVVTAGTKRYELHSKASLEENAVLIFDYKPK